MASKGTRTAEANAARQKLAAVVSERVQILDIRLLECRCVQRRLGSSPSGAITTNIQVETHLNREAESLCVYPRFSLTVREENASPEDAFLEIEARFSVEYRLENTEGITQRNVDAFGERNGVFNVWSYWREFVQSMTVRMGLPPLTLPVFRIGVSKLQMRPESAPQEEPHRSSKEAAQRALPDPSSTADRK